MMNKDDLSPPVRLFYVNLIFQVNLRSADSLHVPHLCAAPPLRTLLISICNSDDDKPGT